MRRCPALFASFGLAAMFLAALAPAARAGDVAFLVVDAKHKPVGDAVVTAYAAGVKADQIHFPWPQAMDQHNLQFDPFVLIVPVGANVSFPNRDPVRHHVYSFSPAKVFELKLYGKDETRSVRFDHAGVVALGCNIHDGMVAFIKVVDTPFAAKTDDKGQAVLKGVPAGQVQVHIWHPYMKSAGNEIVRTVAVSASGAPLQTIQIDVRNAPDRRGSY
ncbi:MAG TPA: methylamine utilization protein [Caulobacteraceae bacterium]|jgi:plastocyanin